MLAHCDRVAHNLLFGLSNHLWWKGFVPHTPCDKPFFLTIFSSAARRFPKHPLLSGKICTISDGGEEKLVVVYVLCTV